MPEILPTHAFAAPPLNRITEDDCKMALKGLMLAMRLHMRNLGKAEGKLLATRKQRVTDINDLRRRKRLAALLGRRGSTSEEVREIVTAFRTQRDEIQQAIDEHIRRIEELRMCFSQQVEDTSVSGFTDLSERWAKIFLRLITPFDTKSQPEPGEVKVREAQTRERKNIGIVWQEIRESIRRTLEKTGKAVPAIAESLKMGAFPAPAIART